MMQRLPETNQRRSVPSAMSHQSISHQDCSSVVHGRDGRGHTEKEDGRSNDDHQVGCDLDENDNCDDDWGDLLSEVEDVRLMLEEELDSESRCDRTSYAGGHRAPSPPEPRSSSSSAKAKTAAASKAASTAKTKTASHPRNSRSRSRPQLPPKASSMPAKLSLPSPERRAEALRLLVASGGGRRSGLTLQREYKRRTYVGRSA